MVSLKRGTQEFYSLVWVQGSGFSFQARSGSSRRTEFRTQNAEPRTPDANPNPDSRLPTTSDSRRLPNPANPESRIPNPEPASVLCKRPRSCRCKEVLDSAVLVDELQHWAARREAEAEPGLAV